MPDQETLLGWIANTKRTQRKLAVITAVLAAISIVLLWYQPLGTIGFIVTISFGVVAFWVTTSHLSDWRYQLDLKRHEAAKRRAAS